jgi:hypothetical protein
MARIVKLSQLLPEDVVFELPDGTRLRAPGDPPLHLVLKIADLFDRSLSEDETVGLELLRELDEQVLALLRMRQPDLEQSPFGVLGVQHFVAELLSAYQFAAGEEEEDPTRGPARKTRSRKPAHGTSS